MQTILIVDDDHSIRAAWKRILELEGYRVETANDGRAGLSLAHDLKPDLIITDQSMLIMDGIEFCCRLKSVLWLAKIPVILASADHQAASDPPAWDELWQKPVPTELILASIRRLRNVHRRGCNKATRLRADIPGQHKQTPTGASFEDLHQRVLAGI